MNAPGSRLAPWHVRNNTARNYGFDSYASTGLKLETIPTLPPDGATKRRIGPSFLCIEIGGRKATLTGIISPLNGQILFFSVTLSTFVSSGVTVLSTEAISVKLHRTCYSGSRSVANCAMTLGVSVLPAPVVEVPLVALEVLIFIISILLHCWHSGVASNPWSIAGIASLYTNPDVRNALNTLPVDGNKISKSALSKAFKPTILKLGHFSNDDKIRYGIMHSTKQTALIEEQQGELALLRLLAYSSHNIPFVYENPLFSLLDGLHEEISESLSCYCCLWLL